MKPDDNHASEKGAQESGYDTSNRPEFTSYYEAQSLRPEFVENKKHLKERLPELYFRQSNNLDSDKPSMLDVGCGAGSQAIVWAKDGHRVVGIDVSERLINVANERMAEAGISVDDRFDLMDLCNKPARSSWVIQNIIQRCRFFRFAASFLGKSDLIIAKKQQS